MSQLYVGFNNYEVCVLQALREKIRVREIWIVGANRFRNPDEDLPTDFAQRRETYYEALRQPTEAEQFTQRIKEAMRKALQSLDGAMPRIRDQVRLLPNRKKKPISITPLTPQPEPRNLASLKQEVGVRWSMTSLLDMLKETAILTGFPDLLTSVASREHLPREVLHRRLILCLYGLGTNTGFKRLPSADPGTTDSDLRYVRSRYIHKEQLRNAIAHVANAIFEVRRAEIWGEGTTACASRLKEIWGLESEPAHRVAYSLSRAGNHDLLACREKIYLHLFSTQKLFFLRSCRHDRGAAAPLYRCRDREKLRRYPWA